MGKMLRNLSIQLVSNTIASIPENDQCQMKRTNKLIDKMAEEARQKRRKENRTIEDEEGQSQGLGYLEPQVTFSSILKLIVFFYFFNFLGLITADL
jgi:hypothetical protein